MAWVGKTYQVEPWRMEVITTDSDQDAVIRALVGKQPWASGGGMGERDQEFDFGNQAEVIEAASRLLNGIREGRVTGARIVLTKDQEED